MKYKISRILITLILLTIITGCTRQEREETNKKFEEEINQKLPPDKEEKENTNKEGKIETNKEIIKYELRTSNYVSSVPKDIKYIIQSESELNKFYSIHSKELNIDKSHLKDNSIFIQVKQLGSGSATIKLKDVTLDNNKVNFITDINSPQTGTSDMAYWYLVAIIPNQKLININTSEWNKPSTIANKY